MLGPMYGSSIHGWPLNTWTLNIPGTVFSISSASSMMPFRGSNAVWTASPQITTSALAICGFGKIFFSIHLKRFFAALICVSLWSQCGAVRNAVTQLTFFIISSVLSAWKSIATEIGILYPTLSLIFCSKYVSPEPIPSTYIAPCK